MGKHLKVKPFLYRFYGDILWFWSDFPICQSVLYLLFRSFIPHDSYAITVFVRRLSTHLSLHLPNRAST